jgi:hypothetical protein
VVPLAVLLGATAGLVVLARVLAGPAPSAFPAPPLGLAPIQAPESWRFGLGVPPEAGAAGQWLKALGAGWYLNWTAQPAPLSPAGVEFWRMVRFGQSGPLPSLDEVRNIAAWHPGQSWLIGNEPDVALQDNATPEQYAEFYHSVFQALKQADPTCQVGVGGLAQVSPLRLAYLDRVLAHYAATYGAPLPADFWGAHLYVLREERGSWGAGIPAGLADPSGWLVAVSDHGRADLVAGQVRDFRLWMQANGYGGQPLVVTEYGILMPPDYGFPPETVARFMRETFNFFLSATDPALGDAQDGGRLVQRWAWFSLAYPQFPASNLVDVQTGELTAVGQAYRDFVAALPHGETPLEP